MKPITEHPEFPGEKEKYMSHFKAFDNPNELIEKHWVYAALNGAYDNGAKAAQSILQKQHDIEMEAFAEWIKEKIENCDIELGLSEYWRMEEHELNSKQLLQLFRERDKQ